MHLSGHKLDYADANMATATQKVSPVMGVLDRLQSTINNTHASVDRLEKALDAVLQPMPPSDPESKGELPASALHGVLIGACDETYRIDKRIRELIDRLTL